MGEITMRLSLLIALAFTGITILTSCDKKIVNPLNDPLPAIRGTVFTAKPTNEGGSLVSPVEGNRTNETPPRYGAKHEFGNLGIEVGYQYIGKGIVRDTSKVDVYLISIKVGDNPVEYESVIYEGGQKVIIERPEIIISVHQDKSNI
jgi:hypothetical protein